MAVEVLHQQISSYLLTLMILLMMVGVDMLISGMMNILVGNWTASARRWLISD